MKISNTWRVKEDKMEWSDVPKKAQNEIIKRLESLGHGYHFGGLLNMEKYVKTVIEILKRSATTKTR